jgi:hypothetical protein
MQQIRNPQELVKTQAEHVPPPDVTVPEPTASRNLGTLDPQVRREIHRLADRVGGLNTLQKLIEALRRSER